MLLPLTKKWGSVMWTFIDNLYREYCPRSAAGDSEFRTFGVLKMITLKIAAVVFGAGLLLSMLATNLGSEIVPSYW
jgi:hypothetical protein